MKGYLLNSRNYKVIGVILELKKFPLLLTAWELMGFSGNYKGIPVIVLYGLTLCFSTSLA